MEFTSSQDAPGAMSPTCISSFMPENCLLRKLDRESAKFGRLKRSKLLNGRGLNMPALNSTSEQKKEAYRVYHRALRQGELTRKPCEVCGNPKTHGHHEDYSKPLEVRWLCETHHGETRVLSPNRVRCPRCNSTQIYHRLTSEDWVCRTCGKKFIADVKS